MRQMDLTTPTPRVRCKIIVAWLLVIVVCASSCTTQSRDQVSTSAQARAEQMASKRSLSSPSNRATRIPSSPPMSSSASSSTSSSPILSSASNTSSIPLEVNCTAGSVHDLVARFVSAFNAGSRRALEQVWAQAGYGWLWYSTDGPDARTNGVADNRAGLGAYFLRRHNHQETLHLLSFRYNGINGQSGDFEYSLVRRADDLAASPYVGKGAVVCSSSPITLGVWSMARRLQT